MRVRAKYEYVDAIHWHGDSAFQDVCDFIGVSPHQEGVGPRRIYLPGRYEWVATPGDWVLRHDMVGDCFRASRDHFTREYDQQGVPEAARRDFPFHRPGVSRYRSRPRPVDAFHWRSMAQLDELQAFIGAPMDQLAPGRTRFPLPMPSYSDERRTAALGQWILRWSPDLFLAVDSLFLIERYDPVDPTDTLLDGVARYHEKDDITFADALYWNGEGNYDEVRAFVGAAEQDAPADRGMLRVSEYRTCFPGTWIVRDDRDRRPDAYEFSGHMERWYDLVLPPGSGPLGHPARWTRPQRFRRRPWPVLALQWQGPANLVEVCAFLGRRLPPKNPDVIHLPGNKGQGFRPGTWITYGVGGYRGVPPGQFEKTYVPYDPPSDPRVVLTSEPADS
ncbi:hypothetical protein RKD23_000630 [Streptomyces sp. SAI-170]|uniref:hypothetical protein n=1 Tax=Streptomyces sp. SAI-170 TaxID=3377729 RepID=UPI003C7BEF72